MCAFKEERFAATEIANHLHRSLGEINLIIHVLDMCVSNFFCLGVFEESATRKAHHCAKPASNICLKNTSGLKHTSICLRYVQSRWLTVWTRRVYETHNCDNLLRTRRRETTHSHLSSIQSIPLMQVNLKTETHGDPHCCGHACACLARLGQSSMEPVSLRAALFGRQQSRIISSSTLPCVQSTALLPLINLFNHLIFLLLRLEARSTRFDACIQSGLSRNCLGEMQADCLMIFLSRYNIRQSVRWVSHVFFTS